MLHIKNRTNRTQIFHFHLYSHNFMSFLSDFLIKNYVIVDMKMQAFFDLKKDVSLRDTLR